MDYYKDSGHLFSKMFHSTELPEFVKEGSYFDTLDQLPDSSFGDPVRRSFPVNDRANTFVSYAYAYAQRDNKVASEALETIQKAATMFGISEELPKLAEHIDGLLSKTASAEPEWQGKTAAFQVLINSPFVGSIVGEGKEAAERAISRFLEILPQVPFDNRTKVAQDLIKAAEENDAAVPEDLQKIAGLVDSDDDTFKTQGFTRLAYVSGIMEKDAAKQLIISADTPEKKLAALKQIDEQYKLARFYNHGILDPHRAVFNTIKKEAKLLKVGSKTYPFEKWMGPGCEFEQAMKYAFGPERAEALVVDGAPVLDGLSESEARLLNLYLA